MAPRRPRQPRGWHDRYSRPSTGNNSGSASRNVSGAEADGPHRAASDPRIHGTVPLRQGGVHRPASGARGAMDPAHGFDRSRQIVAERGLPLLGSADPGLVDEGKARYVLPTFGW